MRLIRLVLLMSLLCLCFPSTAYAAEPGPALLSPVAQDAPPEGEEQAEAEKDVFTNIEDVLGTLGIFSAFMLILAVGTEVTIDSLKVIAGFKSKPTAMETVNNLKSWLPGSLEEMGASGATVSKLKLTLDSMASHMGKVDEATTAITTINEWLPDYLKNFSVDKLQEMLTDKLPELKKELADKVGDEKIATAALGWLRGALATLSATSVSDLTDRARQLVVEFDWLAKEDGQVIADQIAAALQNILPKDMNELAQGGQKLLDERLPHIIETLNANGVDTRVIDQVKTWLGGALTTLGTSESTLYTAAVTNLMQAVEDRRDNIHSWVGKGVRRFFRWIKSHLSLKPNPADSPGKARWRRMLKGILDRIDRFKSGDHLIPPLAPANIARILMERDSAHREEEVSRLRWLRVISVVVGITLAIMLKVDVGELLQPIISPGLHAKLTSELWEVMCTPTQGTNMVFSACLSPAPTGGLSLLLYNFLHMASIGMLLSGLAASAGSAFWHDMLDRLQSAKQAAAQVKDLAAQIQAMEQGK